VLPALLAVSQTRRIDGRTFLAAYITGLEVFFRIALASKGQMGGWHRSAVFGALASAAATAKILELPADGIRAAIGIAAAMTGGLQASFGSMTKAVQVGNAGRAGVVAGLLASDGCTAHTDVLGQPDAFGKAFYSGNFEPEKIVSDFASPLSILDPGIAVKIYPSCGLTHAPADIALSLAHEYDIDSNKIEKVVVYGESFWPDVLIYPEPTTGHQGKYSIPYVVACALVDRRIDPASFTDAAVNRAEIRPCMSKIELATRTDETWNALRQHEWNHPAEVQIEMTGGQTHSQSAVCAIGYPDLALSDDDLLAKFKRCASSRLQPASVNALIGREQELEVVTDVGSIMALTKIPAKD
jgi:2-methylcitrate dehydratase PrpD